MTQKIEVTRRELYDLAWSHPFIKLAVKFGISDRGLAKICKRYRIPTPGIGYWNKLHAGKKLKQLALPSSEFNPVIEIIPTVKVESPFIKQIEEAIAFEKNSSNVILFCDELSHSIVKKIRTLITNKKSETGILLSINGWMESINVSSDSVIRALKIVDIILRSFEKRGHKVFLSDQKKIQLTLSVFDEEFSFRIIEKIKHVELKSHEYRRNWDYIPSGFLRLEFQGEFTSVVVSDTENKKLENNINSILIRLLRAADRIKAKRVHREEQRRQFEIESKIREKRWRQEELEKERFKTISTAAAHWSTIETIRKFMEQVEIKMPLYQLNNEQIEKLHNIIKWTKDYVEKHNPVQLTVNIENKFGNN